jgi:CheY-like chemotaxis protein
MLRPANESDADRTIAGAAAAKPAVIARPRVLVVKDGGGGRAYLCAIRAKGFHVELVPHGEPAIAAVLAPRRYDAILLEQCASPDRGWTLLHLIRVYLARRDVPIVVVARTTDESSAEQRWRTYDVARVFKKSSVTGVALRDCLDKLLGLAAPRPWQASPEETYIVPSVALQASALRFNSIDPMAPAASSGVPATPPRSSTA